MIFESDFEDLGGACWGGEGVKKALQPVTAGGASGGSLQWRRWGLRPKRRALVSDPAHSPKGFRLNTGRMGNTGRLFLGQGSPETRGALCRLLSLQAAGEGRLPRLWAEYFGVWRHAAL